MTETIPAPPWRTPRKAPPRQPLSAELVLATALRIVDKEGLDALSMRRVAQELSTGPASLYAYFSGKEELLEQLLDRVVGEVQLPEVDPRNWVEQLKQVHRDSRRVLRSHRDLARAAQATVPLGENSLRMTEVVLALLHAGGLSDRHAAFAVDQLAQLVVADVVEGAVHQAKGHLTEADAAPYFEQVRDYLAGLPVDRFPRTVAMAHTLTDGDGDERFEFGLNLMINGLLSYAGKRG